jgi:hypothetical protein
MISYHVYSTVVFNLARDQRRSLNLAQNSSNKHNSGSTSQRLDETSVRYHNFTSSMGKSE